MNTRNRFDRTDSLERGARAQKKFIRAAYARGWRVAGPIHRQDMDEHWDVRIEKGAEKFRVDIKAMKRIARADERAQDEWVWVELHGVRAHDRGWLLDGKAELIAFETQNSFLLVPRANLAARISDWVDSQTIVDSPERAQYKVYQRAGRVDKIALIETQRLKEIQWAEWNTEAS
ncbi:MAG: hypothetical protein HY257_11420 [Chloroflexi bacterium]|nr:hypothetical protein [Chloroflexota bacterium]